MVEDISSPKKRRVSSLQGNQEESPQLLKEYCIFYLCQLEQEPSVSRMLNWIRNQPTASLESPPKTVILCIDSDNMKVFF